MLAELVQKLLNWAQDALEWSTGQLLYGRELFTDGVLGLMAAARLWSQGKSPWLRGLLALYLAYAGLRHLGDPMYRSWFSGITLGIHELGHLVTSMGPRWLYFVSGTAFQLAAPAFVALYFVTFQRDYFGSCVGLSWLGFSGYEAATYIDDAAATKLSLVSMGPGAIHDWNWLLIHWDLLAWCNELAMLLRASAFVSWALSVTGMGWLLMVIWRSRSQDVR